MDTTDQARLQQALKNHDLETVRRLVESPVPLSVATILKQSLNSDWNDRPELGARLINATVSDLPEETRESVMHELASNNYQSLIEHSLEHEWCPELSSKIASLLLDTNNEGYTTLTKYIQKQGPAHVLLETDLLSPQYSPHRGLRALYCELFEHLPLDTIAPRVADSRNERALAALLDVHDAADVRTYFTNHTFPSSCHKAANKQAFYERMLRAFDWTDDELNNLLNHANTNKDDDLLRALRSTQGYKPFESERLTEMLGDEFTGSIKRREFQRALIALGAEIPDGARSDTFEEIVKTSDPEALRGWLRSVGYDALVNEQKNNLMESASTDARLAQVLSEEGAEPSADEIGELVRKFVFQAESGPADGLADPSVFYVLPEFQETSLADLAEYLFNRQELNNPELLDAATALLQAGAEFTREQTNLVFEESVEFGKFDTLQALLQTGHRPEQSVYEDVLDRRDERAERVRNLMPRRARQAQQTRQKTSD